jgi:hypothetical protein
VIKTFRRRGRRCRRRKKKKERKKERKKQIMLFYEIQLEERGKNKKTKDLWTL